MLKCHEANLIRQSRQEKRHSAIGLTLKMYDDLYIWLQSDEKVKISSNCKEHEK